MLRLLYWVLASKKCWQFLSSKRQRQIPFVYLTISHRRRREYRRIVTETKSRLKVFSCSWVCWWNHNVGYTKINTTYKVAVSRNFVRSVSQLECVLKSVHSFSCCGSNRFTFWKVLHSNDCHRRKTFVRYCLYCLKSFQLLNFLMKW